MVMSAPAIRALINRARSWLNRMRSPLAYMAFTPEWRGGFVRVGWCIEDATGARLAHGCSSWRHAAGDRKFQALLRVLVDRYGAACDEALVERQRLCIPADRVWVSFRGELTSGGDDA